MVQRKLRMPLAHVQPKPTRHEFPPPGTDCPVPINSVLRALCSLETDVGQKICGYTQFKRHTINRTDARTSGDQDHIIRRHNIKPDRGLKRPFRKVKAAAILILPLDMARHGNPTAAVIVDIAHHVRIRGAQRANSLVDFLAVTQAVVVRVVASWIREMYANLITVRQHIAIGVLVGIIDQITITVGEKRIQMQQELPHVLHAVAIRILVRIPCIRLRILVRVRRIRLPWAVDCIAEESSQPPFRQVLVVIVQHPVEHTPLCGVVAGIEGYARNSIIPFHRVQQILGKRAAIIERIERVAAGSNNRRRIGRTGTLINNRLKYLPELLP